MRAVVALGSNLGDSVATLHGAANALAELADGAVRLSPVYRSAAWGDSSQPDYLNAVAMFDTALGPHALLSALLGIETRFGRQRDRERRYAARTLDLDLIALDSMVLAEADVVLPHPRAHERAFVLMPIADLEPGFELPGRGRVESLLKPEFASLCRRIDRPSPL
jgi:2-amino-4-hydroxy-6-hydroxymethyldihydropteridine diphosphokinase